MKTSEQIDKLGAALRAAQCVMHGAVKDTKNTFFKSNYADLESVWTACRKALTENGMCVIQGIGEDGGLHTRLVHNSGQWIESTTPIKSKDESPQALGSAITYARRYALAAIAGVYQTDDDAEAAMSRGASNVAPAKVDTKIVNQYHTRVINAIDADNNTALREVLSEAKEAGADFATALWATLPGTVKNHIRDHAKEAA